MFSKEKKKRINNMNDVINLSASIVLFKEDPIELKKTIDCFLATPLAKKLFLIDNSPTDILKKLTHHPDIEYSFIGNNIGFGAAHNTVIEKIKSLSTYHLILNPDVSFQPNIITNLIHQLEKDSRITMIAPKVLFPNGKHQYSCRRYPTISELLARRFSFYKAFRSPIIFKGEYRDKDLNTSFFADYLTGCFHLYKTNDFIDLKGFDERYFLYMEDVDICKKIDTQGKKKLYYPKEEITHVLKQGSLKNIKLFFRHTLSAFKYFKKWGF
ncbi:MAG: GT2 family glycosyltransferase [Flavobacteriaceae bacterium]|jgi:GT2 family glycosyltransferase